MVGLYGKRRKLVNESYNFIEVWYLYSAEIDHDLPNHQNLGVLSTFLML